MNRTAAVAFLMTVALGTLGARCYEPRPPRLDARVVSTVPGSCDGVFDFGDEFQISYLQNAGMRPVGFGIWEVELDLEIRNVGGSRFRSASVTPDFSGFPELGVVSSPPPIAADFGPIDPHGSAWSTATLVLQAPAESFDDLMRWLGDGTIPLVVHGDEVNTLAPGVEVREWSGGEDAMYAIAADPAGGFGLPPNADPGAGPFAPGQEFVLLFVWPYSDDLSTVFDSFDAGELFYLVENPDGLSGENENIPDVFDRVRVVDADRVDGEDDMATAWAVTVKLTDTESLPDIYSNASFCTGTSTHVDFPVHKSRLLSLDGDPVDAETSDANPQGIRFNDIPFGGGAVTLSGQIQGHVLKPSLALRIREGRVTARADVETDMSFSAELRAAAETSFAPEDQTLWSLCFPMPSIPAGPVSIPMNLQLLHTIGVEASIGAGAVVGFQKHFESGFSIVCDGGPNVGELCSSEGRREGTPIEFTPPRLTDDTAAHARVETTLETALRVGGPYPLCDTGAGITFEATAYGTLDVTPTEDPWWSVGYGLDTWAGLELQLLGLEIAQFGADPFQVFDAAPSSADPAVRSSGEDQRWAVAIDDTAVSNGVGATKIAALPDGSSVSIASEAIGGRTPLVKLDRFGAMQWVKEFAAGKVPQRVRALPDGTVIVVGSNAWLARVDADGNLLWSFDAEISRSDLASARCQLYDVAPLETAPGLYDYVAVGRMGAAIVTQRDACALRVNADGTLAWARLYAADRVQTFYGVTPMQDGNVMAVGTDAWSFVGNRSIPLFVKLDPATGDVIWWKGMPMTRLAELNAVTEADDGTLYAVGATSGIIYTTGTAIVARIAPDGSDAHHATLYQDEGWEELLDFEAWVDTAGGDTPYDTYFDIAPSGDGFVIVGNTGLGAETAARAAKINRNLGIEWIATYDGADTDGLTGVAPAPDGILVSGYSRSLPEPDGPNTGESQLWVMKLPVTGAMEFLPEVAMTTRFVAPAVRDGTADPAVNPLDEPTIDNPYAVEEAVVVSSGANAGLVVSASPYCVELLTETGRPTTTDTCPDP